MFNFKLRRVLKVLCVELVLLLLVPAAALAAGSGEDWHKVLFTGDSAKSGEIVVLEASKTVKGPGFYSGKTVRIDGNVDGTAFVAGQEVTVNGDIKGDLFAAGQEVTVNGKVYGNLYAAGQKVRLNGRVAGDTFAAGEKAETPEAAVFERDLLVFAANLLHAGRVERQLIADSRYAVLNGFVGDNARISADTLEVRDGADIKGKLVYLSPRQVALSEKAKISGGTEWKKTAPRQVKERRQERTAAGQLFGLLISMAGALLIWFIGTAIKPDLWTSLTKPIFNEPGKTMGIGALALILGPVLAVILMVTFIGLPLAMLLILAYMVALYLAKIITAVFVGSWLAQRFGWPAIHKGVWLVLLGLAINAVLTRLPFVGFLFTLVTVFWGMGAIALAFVRPKTMD